MYNSKTHLMLCMNFSVTSAIYMLDMVPYFGADSHTLYASWPPFAYKEYKKNPAASDSRSI